MLLSAWNFLLTIMIALTLLYPFLWICNNYHEYKNITFRDLELCVGDCALDRAELYDVLISDMVLFPSLGTTVSLAVEYWDDCDAPAPEILGLWCSPSLTVDLSVLPEGSFQLRPCRTLWPLKAAWIVVAALVMVSCWEYKARDSWVLAWEGISTNHKQRVFPCNTNYLTTFK